MAKECQMLWTLTFFKIPAFFQKEKPLVSPLLNLISIIQANSCRPIRPSYRYDTYRNENLKINLNKISM